MHVVPVELPFSVSDGEEVRLFFSDEDLILRFVDWRENRVECTFRETLAFRWSARPTAETPRDDSTYEVLESPWLLDEARLDGYSDPDGFAHYVLCFNASKVLEVLSRRVVRQDVMEQGA